MYVAPEAVARRIGKTRVAAEGAMYATHNDLSISVRESVLGKLQAHLADCLNLFTQLKQAQWNVKGPYVFGLREQFRQSACACQRHSDVLAERITALGGRADAVARIVAAQSTLADFPLDTRDGSVYVAVVAERLSVFTKSVRASIGAVVNCGDVATAALLTGIACEGDRQLGFLDAHLQAES
jgi:starvation-inducible DNA-binding protein